MPPATYTVASGRSRAAASRARSAIATAAVAYSRHRSCIPTVARRVGLVQKLLLVMMSAPTRR